MTKPASYSRYRDVYHNYYQYNHSILGYAALPNAVRPSAKKYYKDILLYDVTYTINGNGLRTTGHTNTRDDVHGCIIFFGGSYTFGEGVNDDESMPFQVALLKDRYNVYNFAFHGYGPHQMLSALEHGIVTDIVSCNKNIHIIYQSIPHHVKRASGLTSWDHHGPRYKLTPNGDAVFSGHFDERPLNYINNQLGRSLIYRNILGINRSANDHDIDLFAAIIKQSKDTATALFPHSSFDIIYWSNGSKDKALKRIRSSELTVHTISDILPNFQEIRITDYSISPHDEHPSALAHRLIAKFVVNTIVQRTDSSDTPN